MNPPEFRKQAPPANPAAPRGLPALQTIAFGRAHIDLDQAGSGIRRPVAGGDAAAPLALRLVPYRLQKDLNTAAPLPAPGLGSFGSAPGAKRRSLHHSGQATTASAMLPRLEIGQQEPARAAGLSIEIVPE